MKIKSTNIKPLDTLIEREGISAYIRDYDAAINGRLNILYADDDFYIAEDMTYQPWLSIMGCLPENWTEQECYNLWMRWIQDEKYIAVYTNIEQISDILQQFDVFSYREDFWIAMIPETKHFDESGIRLATMEDLLYIESTYHRSEHQQLWNQIAQKQMWILEAEQDRKGYAGIHKDGSLGFEYVAPQARRQGVASKLQAFLANHMIENDLIPYVMVSVGNDVAKHLQIKFGSQFAEKIFYFYAKGAYEYE